MLDHIFLSVSDIKRSIGFYEATLAPLGITVRMDLDGYSLEFVYKNWQHGRSTSSAQR
ncbi:hypothetical protein [Pseudomonas sp. HY13-MNA-CIBAN-0226]|uniref:hypothetical protein n=1 Tax=Pseudomonas sp. HY13-MNA-CIBAN-0226 TaxID=3140473 RepID=UPI00332B7D4E